MFDADAGIDGKPLVAAVDIGGTKIAGALVDSSGTLLATTRRPTPATAGAQTVLGAVREVPADLAADGRWPEVSAVGIGSAGPVDVAAGTVSPVNIAAWRGFPLVDEVRRQVGLPVTLIGDGVALAEAEHWQGAATGYRSVLCMVVSTGVGGGLVLDGRVHGGPTGNAGHIGHISVDLDGEPCPCGGRGCVEGLASGPAIARYARAGGRRPGPDGDDSAAAVAESARAGDPVALAAFDRSARALAAAVAATATLVELEAVVIGGGVAAAGPLLFEPLARHLDTYAALPFVRGLRVHHAQLGTDAGLVGAAAAALRLIG
ncbi:ROK family protein [Kitasatospora paracochleata]|uniref:Glucokinase n=1 Tax=Kitasatospora paracochleata TaxID=58354 RepID=A0ABT1IT66_9ACTN|nr:ROK family protein [Kitasatospora paracochleata]MCP2308334.1 glucokinase [Kitasatospora paracochleata]